MADRLEVDLQLNDKISGSAQKAADALKKTESQAQKTKKSLDFSAELHKTEAALGKIKADPKGYASLIKAQKELREERKKLGGGGESFTESFGKKLSFGRLASAAAVGEIAADAIIEGTKKAVELFTEGVKLAFESAGKEEKLRLSYRLTLGEQGGKEYMEEAGRLARLAGFSKSQTAEQIRPLLGAGFRGEKLTQSYALATDIAARKGGGGEAVNEAVDAIRKIELKGGISKKQLAGLGLEKNEDFFKDIASTLHVSQKTAEKMVEEGKVDSQLIINHLSNLVNKAQGGPGGTGGAAYEKTFASRIERLKNLPEEFFREMVDAPGFQVVSDKVADILKQLDPESPNGKHIIASMTSAMDRIGELVKTAFTAENIDKFSNAVTNIIPAAEKVASAILGIANGIASIVNWNAKYSGEGTVLNRTLRAVGLKSDGWSEEKSDPEWQKKFGNPNENGTAAAKVMPANEAHTTNVSAPISNVFNISDADAPKKSGDAIQQQLERAAQHGAQPR